MPSLNLKLVLVLPLCFAFGACEGAEPVEDLGNSDKADDPGSSSDCVAHERPEYTFKPLATCRVILVPQLEDESTKTVQSVDFCVGTGQRVDFFDSSVRHDTLHVIGEYVFTDPDRFGDTFTSKLTDPADLEDDGDVLTGKYSRSQEVVTFETGLMGSREVRKTREFEYSYAYDLRDDTFEFRVKSRPDFFPNWFWEFGMQLECEPVL